MLSLSLNYGQGTEFGTKNWVMPFLSYGVCTLEVRKLAGFAGRIQNKLFILSRSISFCSGQISYYLVAFCVNNILTFIAFVVLVGLRVSWCQAWCPVEYTRLWTR